MARLNIEDSLFKDNRFLKLCVVMGSSRVAIGAIVEAWILAQSYVSPTNPRGLVPAAKWYAQDIAPEILDCKLARLINDQVEIAGGEESFSWLVQKQIAAAKGGAAKAEKMRNMAANGKPQAATRQTSEAETCPLTPTPVLTPTLSLDLTLVPDQNISSAEVAKPPPSETPQEKPKATPRPKKPKDPLATENNRKVWEAYAAAWTKKYNQSPLRNAKNNALVAQLVKLVGVDDSIKLVEFYCTHRDVFYVKNAHPLGALVANCDGLRVQMLNNKQLTGNDLKNYEKMDHYQSQMDRLNKGQL